MELEYDVELLKGLWINQQELISELTSLRYTSRHLERYETPDHKKVNKQIWWLNKQIKKLTKENVYCKEDTEKRELLCQQYQQELELVLAEYKGDKEVVNYLDHREMVHMATSLLKTVTSKLQTMPHNHQDFLTESKNRKTPYIRVCYICGRTEAVSKDETTEVADYPIYGEEEGIKLLREQYINQERRGKSK